MSRFSTTISTVAALATISVTVLTAYKAFDNQSERNAEQQEQIQQLEAMVKKQQVVTELTQPPPVELPPAVPATPDPTESGSATVPPPVPQ